MNEVLETINRELVFNIVIAIAIVILFQTLSSSIAYFIVRLFKFNRRKTKAVKEIRESAFYNPLKVFFMILGVYVGFIYLRTPLNISENIMGIVTSIFKVVSILAFTRALAASFVDDSSLVKKIRKKYKKEDDDNMFSVVLKVVRAIIYTIGVLVVIIVLGIDITGLVAGLGIGGIVITLAAQDTAKNLLGGAMIFMDKPFAVGEWIQIDKYEGTVEDITFRSTRIRTFENALVNIPNGNVTSTSLTNWSKMEKRRYKTNITVELATPLEKLERFKLRVENMLKERESILEDSIIVKFDIIRSNSLNILIYSFADCVDYIGFLTEKENINYKIMAIVHEEGIKLACDEQTINIKKT